MTAMYQYIIEERKANIREGIAKSRIEVAQKLLKIKMPIEQIIEVTGLSKEEIEKISKKCNIKNT